MYRYSLRGALLASTAFVMFGSGAALAQAGGSCTTTDGAQVCEGDQPTVNTYGFGVNSFTNTGTLNSTYLYLYNNTTPLTFLNTESGIINTSGYGIPSAIIEGWNPAVGMLHIESFVNRGYIGSTVGAAVFTGSQVGIGRFENSGTIEALGEGHTPGGCFFAEDYAVEIQGRVTGDFTNTGDIVATDTAVHVVAIDGDFINEGDILVIGGEAFGDTAVRIGTLGGDFINGAEASIMGYVDAVDVEEIAGDFINYGLISGEVEAYEIGSLEGDFLNFGTIESTANHHQGAGWIGYLGGNYLNAAGGEILSEDHGIVIGTMNGASFTNDGLISSVYHAVQIYDPSSSYIFTNSGEILTSEGNGVTLGSGFGVGAEGQNPGGLASHELSGEVAFINSGDIVAAVTGLIAYDDISSFDNSGLIDGGLIAVNLAGNVGAFLNTGDIIGGQAGVRIANLSGDFVNEGLIEATRGYVSDREAPKSADAISGSSNGVGVIAGLVEGDFINRGEIRGSGTGVSISALGGDFINQGLIESTFAPEAGVLYNSGGENFGYYGAYALEIITLGGGAGGLSNSGLGSSIGAEDLSFFNSEKGQIIGADRGIRIHNMMGPVFYNGGLISAAFDAVAIDRAYNDYSFTNYGDILSSEGDGVSLGNFNVTPVAEPLDLAAARSGGEYSPATEVEFFNGGNIIAGRTGVSIANDVYLFQNEGLISGSDYGVRLTGSVFGFINQGTITATGAGTPPPPPQRPYSESITLAAPALWSRAWGDGVGLDYVEGGIVNGPDGNISGSFRGLNAYVVGNLFVNAGTVSGGYQGVSIFAMIGDFINDGVIEQTLASDDPDASAVSLVYLEGDEGFNNRVDGEIISQNAGVVVSQFLSGDFLNDGLISSVGDAVSLQFVGGERAFENNGDIISTQGAGVILSHTRGGCGMAPLGTQSLCASDPLGADVELMDLSFRNTGGILSSVLGVRIDGIVNLFDNRGIITGGKVGVDLLGDVESLYNFGSISGDQTGIRFNGSVGYLYNAGSITGLTGGESGIGAGLRVYGDAGTQLLNIPGGSITGFTGLVFGDGEDHMANAGSVTGTGGVAVSLGGGDDTFFSHSIGRISGAVDGGADYDVFYASGTHTLDMAINNFEEMWLIAGDFTFGHDQSVDYMVSGGESLDLAGFTFTGDLLSYADLYANGGSVDGSVVNFGNILALDLTVTGDLYNGGTINPGGTGAISTLTVLGDFFALNIGDSVDLPGRGAGATSQSAATLSPTASTLVFNFSGLNHDQIIVTGSATLGGDLIVTGDLDEAIKARQNFTLISASSMSGSFNLLNIGGVLFAPKVDTVGADVLLSFARNNFVASLAPGTRNQTQAALGLEDRWDQGASAADDIILALNAGASSAPILEAFAPETSAALTRQSARIGTNLAQTVANCAIGENAGSCGRRESDGSVLVWTNVSASGARLKTDGNAARVDEAFSQVSSGVEYAFGSRLAGGIFLASGTGDVDIDNGLRGHGEIDSVAGGVYARMQAGRFTLSGLAGFGDTDIQARRHTPHGSSIGETGGSVSFARLDARLTLVSGISQAGFTMSGTYAYAEIGNFAQRGAGGYDLDIVGDSFRVEDWDVRAFFGHDFAPAEAAHLWSIGGTAGLVHANGEDMASAAARFPGGTAPFEALGPRTTEIGGVASGYLNLASPVVGVSAQLGVEGRWMEGEETSRVYGRFAWTF